MVEIGQVHPYICTSMLVLKYEIFGRYSMFLTCISRNNHHDPVFTNMAQLSYGDRAQLSYGDRVATTSASPRGQLCDNAL